MKKGFVFLIVFGSILFVAGSAAFGLAIAKDAFKNNSLTQEVTKEYVLEDSFNKIDVDIVTADLTFKPSEDDKTKVVSVEKEKIHHTAKVSNDTLVMTPLPRRSMMRRRTTPRFPSRRRRNFWRPISVSASPIP